MLSKNRTKYIQSLGQKKFRDEERLFIAEGPKIVAELLQSEFLKVKEIFATEEWINSGRLTTGQLNITMVTPAELEKISQLITPNQVLALVEMPESPEIPVAAGRITLVLDDIRDPGNLGTLIRIADWFGISQIVCSRETADLYNPKVVQSTMGSLARVNVFYTDLAHWISRQEQSHVYASVLDGQDISTMKKISEGIILIGNESRGISHELLAFTQFRITIPSKGKAESLNAAVAAGIILSHLT